MPGLRPRSWGELRARTKSRERSSSGLVVAIPVLSATPLGLVVAIPVLRATPLGLLIATPFCPPMGREALTEELRQCAVWGFGFRVSVWGLGVGD